jgi:hypothetical protein
VIATAAPWGWLGWMTPVLLLVLLFTITGILPTEEQALRSRAEDYPALPAGDLGLRPLAPETPVAAPKRRIAAATLTANN